ncbi:MAG: hypothetical protein ACTHNP_04645 [Solirubrobacterales bacterium]
MIDEILASIEQRNSVPAPAEVLAHMPGVCFPVGMGLTHEGFEVREVPFEHWEKFDSFLAQRRRRQYEATRPVFLVGQAQLPLDDAAADYVEQLTLDVHAALTLVSPAPLPSPEMSIAYIRREDGVQRRMGPMEREGIIHGQVILQADEDLLTLGQPMLELAARNREARRAGFLRRVMDSLAASALPDFAPADGTVQCAVALEALLLSDVTTSLTSTFAERGAALLADEDGEAPDLREQLRIAYGLRSDLLHGRDSAATLAATERSEAEWWDWLRHALTRAVARVLWALDGATDLDAALAELRRELDSARHEGRALTRLAAAPAIPLP